MSESTLKAGEGLGAEPRTGLSAAEVRSWAKEAGFTEVGVVALPHGADERDAERFEGWIGAGNAGTMRYLERKSADGRLLRSRVGIPFPWAHSAVVCFAGYNSAAPPSTEPAEVGAGWIARYAWSSRKDAEGRRPSDYHKVLKKRLEALEVRIREERVRAGRPGDFEARGYVDTGPVVERSLATAAGLGWIGKNTCLIHPKLGSFGFLAVLLTSLPVQEKMLAAELVPDRCGTCRRCIEACPTDALVEPYKMDATRCISYLTIEHKGEIARGVDGWDGAAGFWLRHLPGCLSVEFTAANAGAFGCGVGGKERAGESGAGVVGGDG